MRITTSIVQAMQCKSAEEAQHCYDNIRHNIIGTPELIDTKFCNEHATFDDEKGLNARFELHHFLGLEIRIFIQEGTIFAEVGVRNLKTKQERATVTRVDVTARTTFDSFARAIKKTALLCLAKDLQKNLCIHEDTALRVANYLWLKH